MTKNTNKKLKRIAIFIDAANFEISLKSCNLHVDYHELINWAKTEGQVVMLRYYSVSFGTKGQNGFFSFIKNCGFKIVTKNIKIIKQYEKQSKHKANFDVEITFDAAMHFAEFDNLILFSGDSDFVYLASQLQKRNVLITVISPQWRTARELKDQADVFMDLRNCGFVKKSSLSGALTTIFRLQKEYIKKRIKSQGVNNMSVRRPQT